jgi:hypothetical protein
MNWLIGSLTVLGAIGIGLFLRTMKAEDHSVWWKVCKRYFAYYVGLLLIGLTLVVTFGWATLMMIGSFAMWLASSVALSIIAHLHTKAANPQQPDQE